MKVTKFGLFLLVASLAGCKTTSVVVTNPSGAAVAGAEVFLKGRPQGPTNAAGQFVGFDELSSGDQLFARRLVYEHPSYRPDHGPGSGWVMRVYQTSRIVNNDGSVTDLRVNDPTVTQTLTVSPDNALIGWHLVASLDWDASEGELDELRTRFIDASQYLYNLTDGQFFIEQVEIADDAQLWGSAEIAFQVDTWVWPHATYLGGFLGRAGAGGSHIYMSPFSDDCGPPPFNNCSGSTNPATIIHELGHLALGLADEYAGTNAFARNYCTAARRSGPPGDFGAGGSRAACAMDDHFKSSKLCSAHPDSAHRGGNWQPGPCWNTVAAGYADPAPGVPPRWVVRTPDMRGAVVGTLPPLPEGLRPKINVMNRKHHDLCQPFTFVDPAGASAAGGTVWVRPSFWGRDFTVGRLDNNSTVVVHGAHLGDMIVSPRTVRMVDVTMCAVTQ